MLSQLQFWRPFTSALYTNNFFSELSIVVFYFGWVGFQRETFAGTLANSIAFLSSCKQTSASYLTFRLLNFNSKRNSVSAATFGSIVVDLNKYTVLDDES